MTYVSIYCTWAFIHVWISRFIPWFILSVSSFLAYIIYHPVFFGGLKPARANVKSQGSRNHGHCDPRPCQPHRGIDEKRRSVATITTWHYFFPKGIAGIAQLTTIISLPSKHGKINSSPQNDPFFSTSLEGKSSLS